MSPFRHDVFPFTELRRFSGAPPTLQRPSGRYHQENGHVARDRGHPSVPTPKQDVMLTEPTQPLSEPSRATQLERHTINTIAIDNTIAIGHDQHLQYDRPASS